MANDTTTVMGVSLGWRYMGTAVMRGNDLLDWRIKLIRARRPDERIANLRRILTRIVEVYHPQCVALKGIHPSKRSPSLAKLIDEVKRFAIEQQIRFEEYSLATLKRTILKGEKGGKRKLAEVLSAQHPVLYHLLQGGSRERYVYHARAFEAVAAARQCAMDTMMIV